MDTKQLSPHLQRNGEHPPGHCLVPYVTLQLNSTLPLLLIKVFSTQLKGFPWLLVLKHLLYYQNS